MKKKYIFLSSILFILLAGCSTSVSFESSRVTNETEAVEVDSEIEDAGKEERIIGVRYEYDFSLNFEEVIEKSDLIVTGYYGDVESKWNMSRDVNNPNIESNTSYTEGVIYNFSIEEVLYSSRTNKDTSILVNLRHFDKIDVTFDDGSVEYINYVDPLFIEPSTSDKYILLLKYNSQYDCYFKSTEPFQFKVSDNEITPVSNLFSEEYSNITKYNNITVNGNSFDNFPDHFSGTKIEELKKLNDKVKK